MELPTILGYLIVGSCYILVTAWSSVRAIQRKQIIWLGVILLGILGGFLLPTFVVIIPPLLYLVWNARKK